MERATKMPRMRNVDVARFRQCTKCGEFGPPDMFHHHASTVCIVCHHLAKAARPWTAEETQRLYDAGRALLNLWPQYDDRWTKADLNLWRAFLNAMERVPAGGEVDGEGEAA
jgi:hypothetical protein